MEYLIPALTTLLVAAPLVILYGIGIVIAISRRQRHPKVSLLTILALTIQIFLTVASRIISFALPLILRDRGWATSQIGQVFFAQAIVVELLEIAVWILLLYAVFGWRGKPEPSSVFIPPPPSFTDEKRTSPTISPTIS